MIGVCSSSGSCCSDWRFTFVLISLQVFVFNLPILYSLDEHSLILLFALLAILSRVLSLHFGLSWLGLGFDFRWSDVRLDLGEKPGLYVFEFIPSLHDVSGCDLWVRCETCIRVHADFHCQRPAKLATDAEKEDRAGLC